PPTIPVLLRFVYAFLTSTPWSPLFPYTTLFRSQPAHVPDVLGRRGLGGPAPVHRRGRLVELDDRVRPGPEQAAVLVRHAKQGGEDRKCTRLNSSHVSFSYAVFCLKKKYIYIM